MWCQNNAKQFANIDAIIKLFIFAKIFHFIIYFFFFYIFVISSPAQLPVCAVKNIVKIHVLLNETKPKPPETGISFKKHQGQELCDLDNCSNLSSFLYPKHSWLLQRFASL